jgi:hypothetical protein
LFLPLLPPEFLTCRTSRHVVVRCSDALNFTNGSLT